jgi:hypothetical protein
MISDFNTSFRLPSLQLIDYDICVKNTYPTRIYKLELQSKLQTNHLKVCTVPRNI